MDADELECAGCGWQHRFGHSVHCPLVNPRSLSQYEDAIKGPAEGAAKPAGLTGGPISHPDEDAAIVQGVLGRQAREAGGDKGSEKMRFTDGLQRANTGVTSIAEQLARIEDLLLKLISKPQVARTGDTWGGNVVESIMDLDKRIKTERDVGIAHAAHMDKRHNELLDAFHEQRRTIDKLERGDLVLQEAEARHAQYRDVDKRINSLHERLNFIAGGTVDTTLASLNARLAKLEELRAADAEDAAGHVSLDALLDAKPDAPLAGKPSVDTPAESPRHARRRRWWRWW